MKNKKEKISPQNALDRLMTVCSKSEKSIAEIEQKLTRWNLSDHTTEIITRLKDENFINEERFARAFVHDKLKFNKWGKIRLGIILRNHKVTTETIQEVLNEIDEDNYYDIVSGELQKKQASLKKLSGYELKAKLYTFGTQRGYESDIMHRYFNEKGL